MKKYTKLGLLAGGVIAGFASLAPLTTYAESVSTGEPGKPSNPSVTVTVNPIITIDSTTNVTIETNSKDVKTGTFDAKVTANKGYTISLSAEDDDKAALSTSDSNETIPASSTLVAGQNGWGIRKKSAANSTSDADDYTMITGTPQEFYRSTTSGNGATTRFEIGVAISRTLAPGNYKTNIIVTAGTT